MSSETRRFRITVKHRRRLRTSDCDCQDWNGRNCRRHGFTSEPDPDTDTVEAVDVTIDWDRIAKSLGDKAVFSSGGKSQEIAGLVVVKHIRK